MMNVMQYVKINNATFEDYSEQVSIRSDALSQFFRELVLTKVDEHTAILTAELFDPEGLKTMVWPDAYKAQDEKLGLERTLYNLQPFE
jgi:hypothetical protein